MSFNKGWIGVDLDGTLAEYTGWRGKTHIGPPIKKMQDRVLRWLGQSKEVRIFTARAIDGEQSDAVLAIKKWCLEHLGYELPVTCTKDYDMIELWDDRAIQVIKNTGERADRCKDIGEIPVENVPGFERVE